MKKYLILPIKNSFNYKGKETRKNFWLFMLLQAIIFILGLLTITTVFALMPVTNIGAWDFDVVIISYVSLYSLFIWFPMVSISIRRLHDIGFSGWWCLLFYVPVVLGRMPNMKNNPSLMLLLAACQIFVIVLWIMPSRGAAVIPAHLDQT